MSRNGAAGLLLLSLLLEPGAALTTKPNVIYFLVTPSSEFCLLRKSGMSQPDEQAAGGLSGVRGGSGRAWPRFLRAVVWPRRWTISGFRTWATTTGPDCRIATGLPSRRRDCHYAATPSSPMLKRLLKGEGGAAE